MRVEILCQGEYNAGMDRMWLVGGGVCCGEGTREGSLTSGNTSDHGRSSRNPSRRLSWLPLMGIIFYEGRVIVSGRI